MVTPTTRRWAPPPMPDETHPRDEVERRVLRGLVTLRVVRDPERRWLAGGRQAWPQDLIDSADALVDVVRKGKASLKFKRLRVADFDDLHFGPADPDEARWVPPFEPTSRDVSQYLEACGWWAALARMPSKRRMRARPAKAEGRATDRHMRVVEWVAYDISMREIARRLGCIEATAERWYGEAIDDLHRIANGWVKLD